MGWKKGRIKKVRKFIRKMLVIFPFEEPFYREQGIEAEFVGHPLAELPLPSISREEYARKPRSSIRGNGITCPRSPSSRRSRLGFGMFSYELDPRKEWIALLPGSRYAEIVSNFQTMVKAAVQLGDEYEYIVPLAPTLTEQQISRIQEALGIITCSHPPRITFVATLGPRFCTPALGGG